MATGIKKDKKIYKTVIFIYADYLLLECFTNSFFLQKKCYTNIPKHKNIIKLTLSCNLSILNNAIVTLSLFNKFLLTVKTKLK